MSTFAPLSITNRIILLLFNVIILGLDGEETSTPSGGKTMEPDLIDLIQDNPLSYGADVLIHPTTGAESPSTERFPGFYERVGDDALRAFRNKQPLRMGEATSTGGGQLDFDTVVHVPVRTGPNVPTTPDNLQVAYRTALVSADEEPHRTLVVPAPVNSDDLEENFEEAATRIWQDFLQYPSVSLRKIRIIDPDSLWIETFQELKAQD